MKTCHAEIVANKCNALNAEVTERKGLFATRLTLTLKDCQGNVIYKSKEGNSREKESQPAYELALRDAFSSLNDVAYKYDGTSFSQPQQVVTPASSSSSPATTLLHQRQPLHLPRLPLLKPPAYYMHRPLPMAISSSIPLPKKY